VATFEVLPGLPPYGPWAEAFTATGLGRQREGFVVRFHPDQGESWVGNFQPGMAGIDTVLWHPNERELLVIAGGQGYVVDPNDRAKREYFGAAIELVIPVPELGTIVFGNGLWFESLGSAGWQWRSNRISWNGMQEVHRDRMRLTGEAWSPLQHDWLSFELDLRSGVFTGGSYNGPR
jgi:hypothetical protein